MVLKNAPLALMLCCTSAFGASKSIRWETAIVVSQNLGSQTAGAIVVPVGTIAVAAPIGGRTNIVVIDTAHLRYTLSEPDIDSARIFRRS